MSQENEKAETYKALYSQRRAESEAKDAELSALRERLERAEQENAELNTALRGPRWTCAACGSSDRFNGIKYDVPGEPIEYDMECEDCGSTDVRETASEAARALGDKLEETLERAAAAESELADLRARNARLEDCTMRLKCRNCSQTEDLLAKAKRALDILLEWEFIHAHGGGRTPKGSAGYLKDVKAARAVAKDLSSVGSEEGGQ